jgi:HK97 gp10 family phage protein
MAANSADGALAGSADLIKKLQALGALDNGNIMLGALRAGMKEALKLAQNKIPVGTRMHRTYQGRLVAPGFGKRNLRIVTTRKTDSGLPAALLGVRKEAYYETQFLELGTSKMRAQPWLRSAFYNSQDAQKRAIVAYLQKRLEKLIKTGTP